MGSLLSENRGAKYLLCVIDVFTKYFWLKHLKDEKAEIVFHGFIKVANKYKCKSNKLWVNLRK